MHPGQGPGLSLHDLGETGGSETVTLLESEIPSHSHALARIEPPPIGGTVPGAAARSRRSPGHQPIRTSHGLARRMAPEALAPAGGDQPHNNLQPYLTFYFSIALQGVFPPRS